VVSTYFTFAYVGLTLPVIAVGFAADRIDFFGAVLACSIGLAALCVLALLLGGRARPVSRGRPHDTEEIRNIRSG
jgi:hypothetical protein